MKTVTNLSKRVIISLCAMTISFNIACSADKDARMSQHNAADTVEHEYTNHLIDENSPYLLSHAHNPVNWYPWGEEALGRARKENKPIFLSIGYSACHWCHVMERESFENTAIASILNKYFISIKVDREQRPDLDRIYMAFTTAMTGSGGWPMSIFMTPDLIPFFAGTYFPPQDRYGRPGFQRIISQIGETYQTDRAKLTGSSQRLFDHVSAQISASPPPSALHRKMVEQAAGSLIRNFDHVNGGFGQKPKFPHATELSMFMRYSRASGDDSYLKAATLALTKMARGGIYDHVGGGFARYSTDEAWLVPHFEKMLYDNGLLVPVYAEAFQITGDKHYLTVIRETLDFILREMTDQSGGFYSALDADSEGEEGKFYVWSKAEIDELLGDDALPFIEYYNVSVRGNFEGHNILNVTSVSDRVRSESDKVDFDAYLASSRSKLLDARTRRVRPATDDKILTSWNGLAISAFCRGYQVTGDERYLRAAIKAVSFIEKDLFHDGSLTHSYREGRRSSGDFLEDYAYLLRGVLDLYESDRSAENKRWLDFATKLADRALSLFMDESGKLYLRPAGQNDLIVRPQDNTDGAIPAPGSFLMMALLKLHRITENPSYLSEAEKGLRLLSGLIEQAPGALTSAACAVDYYLNDKIEVVLVGDGPVRDDMLRQLYSWYHPNRLIAMSTNGASTSPLFEGRAVSSGDVRAYVCKNSVCKLPVSTGTELMQQLRGL
ncbi:MAG: thioredoxin domain-containing protein [Candidatus Zixiibacteriota bacterium]